MGDIQSTGDMTVSGFLEALAARSSTPGGGGAAAVSGSMAAALISMVINFTAGSKKYADVEEEMRRHLVVSEGLRGELLALADRDVEAFNAVSACYGMPKATDEEKAARTAALQEALKGATRVPYLTAEKCLAVIELAEPVGAKGNANVVSDAATALHLATAALHSALVNVNINLKFIKDEAFVAEWSAKRDDLLARLADVHARAVAACEQTLGMSL
ncbi:MAG: cyclodeaminase/cyclohydrolase family protein [Chloroflexota bacterium]|nr:cyclodeaminase/cyclohydrolase family protein [Chloroflexota bacterium]